MSINTQQYQQQQQQQQHYTDIVIQCFVSMGTTSMNGICRSILTILCSYLQFVLSSKLNFNGKYSEICARDE